MRLPRVLKAKLKHRVLLYALCSTCFVLAVIALVRGLLQFIETKREVNAGDACSCDAMLIDKQRRLDEWEARLLAAERGLRLRHPGLTDALVGGSSSAQDLPIIYVVTPTYARTVQKAELTRLSQTLQHVPALHWIVVDDGTSRSPLVERLLQKTGIVHTHLFVPTAIDEQHNERWWKRRRGVCQRNLGLQWIRNHLRNLSETASSSSRKSPSGGGVVYFADDDNVYDVKLFEEMRSTKTVSVWPVGLACDQLYESPFLDVTTGLVAGWVTCRKRPFATDMAGFSVNTRLIMEHPEVEFNVSALPGRQETAFLEQLVSNVSSLEPKADNLTKVLVWHTKTLQPPLKNQRKMKITMSALSLQEIEV